MHVRARKKLDRMVIILEKWKKTRDDEELGNLLKEMGLKYK